MAPSSVPSTPMHSWTWMQRSTPCQLGLRTHQLYGMPSSFNRQWTRQPKNTRSLSTKMPKWSCRNVTTVLRLQYQRVHCPLVQLRSIPKCLLTWFHNAVTVVPISNIISKDHLLIPRNYFPSQVKFLVDRYDVGLF